MILSRLLAAAILGFLPALAGALPASAEPKHYGDRELMSGFEKTVFGLEYKSTNGGEFYVKKFTGPVRVFIDRRSRLDRTRAVRGFIGEARSRIHGLDIAVTKKAGEANFRIFVVDRADYDKVVRAEVFGDRGASSVGACMVRVRSDRRGIRNATAVIVSDEGEFLFRRCLIEETLQGLGPLNDDASLAHSVFNDRSRASRFTRHDRFILNMLYHPGIRPGMSKSEALAVLPEVVGDVRRRLR
ncbi:MAG: DUF2927 domain-containing protein [Hyphomicrobiales bacterium]